MLHAFLRNKANYCLKFAANVFLRERDNMEMYNKKIRILLTALLQVYYYLDK